MMKRARYIIFLLTLLLAFPNPIFAQTYSSGNYQVNQVFFGTGGELDATSPFYRAHSSVGSLGVGASSSTNYDAESGYLTAGEPYLEMVVSNATVDFGTLSDTVTASGAAQADACNCSFVVRTYLSSQYVVATMSQPPTNESGFSLTTKTVQASPSVDPNIEEFGINVVANTSPNMGANPVNQPDNTFADGEATSGYSVANQFKYVVGENIARSAATSGNQAVGQTDYTISYIAKRNSITRAGLYTMRHDLVAIATY